MERDLDNEDGFGATDANGRQATDESLGMDGLEVKLDEYPVDSRAPR